MIAISFAILEQFRVILNFVLRAKLGECVALWFALTPPPLTWLTEQKNQLKVFKHTAWYSEFGYKLSPNSLYHAARFANFERILGFSVPSIILTDLLGNTCLLVIGAFRPTLIVSVFQDSLLVIALFRAIIELFPSKIFRMFLIIVSRKNKAMSASCSGQKFHSSWRFPSLFLSSLESFFFVFADQTGRVRCIVICINSALTQMIDETEKPTWSLQTSSEIQRVWL